MGIIEQIKQTVIRGRIDQAARYPPDMAGQPGVKELVAQGLEEGQAVAAILREGLIAGMDEVGGRFSRGEYFVPEMLMCAKAMKGGLEVLRPLMLGQASMSEGTVILGTVKGDMHDIGKNLVAMMLEGAGFEVIDAGINTPPEKFVEMARDKPRAIVGLSALLTITMHEMKNTIAVMRQAGLPNKVIIGGAPVSQEYADEIGADGFAADAALAVPLAKALVAASV